MGGQVPRLTFVQRQADERSKRSVQADDEVLAVRDAGGLTQQDRVARHEPKARRAVLLPERRRHALKDLDRADDRLGGDPAMRLAALTGGQLEDTPA